MNLLFHMYLSGVDQELLVGNLMGDFVKGPLGDAYPCRVRQGLMLHRKIDSFAQRDDSFQASRLRLASSYGLYRGVLVDLFYDHFLAKGWGDWCDTPFTDYLSWARDAAESRRAIMPQPLQEFLPVIFEQLLPSYGTVGGIEAALGRMARRVRRPNPLAEGGGELTRNYCDLKTDFEGFIVAVRQFATDYIENGGQT